MAGVGGAESARMRLAEPMAALSLITDLAMGKPTETAIRAGIVAACLTERLGLSATERRHVYYATLLRSIGCTSTSHEMAGLFGDDIEASRKAGVQGDVTPAAVARLVIDLAGRDLPLVDRVGLLAMLAIRGKSIGVSGMTAHCEVGARMAERFELGEEVRLALEQVSERWDGAGYPRHLRGERSPFRCGWQSSPTSRSRHTRPEEVGRHRRSWVVLLGSCSIQTWLAAS